METDKWHGHYDPYYGTDRHKRDKLISSGVCVVLGEIVFVSLSLSLSLYIYIYIYIYSELSAVT
jgi:hypothetical protein